LSSSESSEERIETTEFGYFYIVIGFDTPKNIGYSPVPHHKCRQPTGAYFDKLSGD